MGAFKKVDQAFTDHAFTVYEVSHRWHLRGRELIKAFKRKGIDKNSVFSLTVTQAAHRINFPLLSIISSRPFI